MKPELAVTLLDSVGKKVKACDSFVSTLKLVNTRTIYDRAEQAAMSTAHAHAYDVVVSKATAYLPLMLEWSEMFLRAKGKIIMYKTPSDSEMQAGAVVAERLKLRLLQQHSYSLGGQLRKILVYTRMSRN